MDNVIAHHCTMVQNINTKELMKSMNTSTACRNCVKSESFSNARISTQGLFECNSHKSQHQHLGPQPTSALPTICSMVSMRRLLVVRSPLFESQGGSAVRNEYEIHNGRAAGWKLWPISQTEIWQLLLFTCPEHRVGSINNQSYGILNVSMYIRFMFMYCISYSINFIYTAN